MRSLLREGVQVSHGPDRVGSGVLRVPGSRAEAFVVVPMVHEGLVFGLLSVGRTRASGRPAPEFNDSEVEEILALARRVTPFLRTAVLLRYLKLRLRAVD
jgi:hypothetical protein